MALTNRTLFNRLIYVIPGLLAVMLFSWVVWFTQFSWNALFSAAHNGDVGCVKTLLAQGIPVDVRDPMGKGTALMVAAHNPGGVESCRVLLDRGANINATNVFGNTALMLAASNGCTDVVRLLLNRGANIALTNKKGHTALYLAGAGRHDDIVALLQQARTH